MRSMMAALNLIAVSIGSLLSAFLLKMVNGISEQIGDKWIPDNLNEGHLDYYFILIGGQRLWKEL